MKLACNRSIGILSVGIKYSIRDVVCDVINYNASSISKGKYNLYDKIVITIYKPKKEKKCVSKKFFS